MKEFKVGDRVVMKGVVTDIDHNHSHCIVVDFNGEKNYFTKKGSLDMHEKVLHLNHDDAKEFPRLMEVRDKGLGEWSKRVIAGILMGKAIGFVEGMERDKIDDKILEEDMVTWDEYREIQEPEVIELTIDQIAEKFGTTAELIKIKK